MPDNSQKAPKPPDDDSVVSGLLPDDAPIDGGDSGLMLDTGPDATREAVPKATRTSARASVPSPRAPTGPWREVANQDRWQLTQSAVEWLHPFALLGPIPTFKEYQGAMAACTDFLSKEAARARSTPDQILRSERFQQCQGLDAAGYLREMKSFRLHSQEWYGLKQLIDGACADGLLALSERRLIITRAQEAGFTEKEILRWIAENHPNVREEAPTRAGALLRGVFDEEIANCDAFVDYVSSSSKHWSEAVQKRGQITVVAPNLAGEEGRRFEDAVMGANRALVTFKANLGFGADQRRDDSLWLLAVLWKAGAWKEGRPVVRLPNPWEGEWIHEPSDLVRAVDARPKAMEALLRSYQLPFWLAQDPTTRDLVSRITRDVNQWEANAWQVLWEYGETRIRVAKTEIRGDADILAFLSTSSTSADLAEFDRMIDSNLFESWASRLGHSNIQVAVARCRAIPNPALRRRAFGWSLGSRVLAPGVSDVQGFIHFGCTDSERATELIRDGSLSAWLTAIGQPTRIESAPEWSGPRLLHAWLWVLGAPLLIVGSQVFSSPTDLVTALAGCDSDATRLLAQLVPLLESGTLDAWLPAMTPQPTGVGLDGVCQRLWRIGLRSFYEPRCGWMVTPHDLAEWADESPERSEILVSLLKDQAIDWLGLVAPDLVKPVQSALAGPEPAEYCSRLLGLAAPTLRVQIQELDFGWIQEGGSGTRTFEVSHVGSRGVALVKVDTKDSWATLVVLQGKTPLWKEHQPERLAVKSPIRLLPGQSFSVEVRVSLPEGRTLRSDEGSTVILDCDGSSTPVLLRYRSRFLLHTHILNGCTGAVFGAIGCLLLRFIMEILSKGTLYAPDGGYRGGGVALYPAPNLGYLLFGLLLAISACGLFYASWKRWK